VRQGTKGAIWGFRQRKEGPGKIQLSANGSLLRTDQGRRKKEIVPNQESGEENAAISGKLPKKVQVRGRRVRRVAAATRRGRRRTKSNCGAHGEGKKDKKKEMSQEQRGREKIWSTKWELVWKKRRDPKKEWWLPPGSVHHRARRTKDTTGTGEGRLIWGIPQRIR